MTRAEKHIRRFNRLEGNSITRETLKEFHDAIKTDIESKRIDAHMPLGVECLDIEKRLAAALRKMNGHVHIVDRVHLVKTVDVGKILELQKVNVERKRKPKPKAKPQPKPEPKPEPQPVKKSKPKVTKVKPKKVKHAKEVVKKIVAKKPAIEKTPKVEKANPPAKPVTKSINGFTTANNAPANIKRERLPGAIGDFLQNLQRFKLEIVVAGETHSGKSEIGKQIADAFISHGDDVAWIDWEQGGLESSDTTDSINRNVKPENKKRLHVNGNYPKTIEAVKALAKDFKVIVLDSGNSLKQVTNLWMDELREEFPDTVWIILMQQNSQGKTRGGSSAEFDLPVVIYTYRPDESDYTKNYAKLFKNRGNKTGLFYNISEKRIIPDPAKQPAPPLTPAIV